MTRTILTPAELAYLTGDNRLARVATANRAGRPHVTPVGMWRYLEEEGVVEITGHAFSSTRKYRNVAENPQAALVVDDIAPGEGWSPRGVMLEGPAEAHNDGQGGVIRLRVDHVASWGLEAE